MSQRIPTYRHHKARGLAVVTIKGKDIYLGPYGTVESRQKYAQVLTEYMSGVTPTKAAKQLKVVSVHELVLAFMRHADTHYVKNGKPTAEIDCLKSAANPLVELYGESDAALFSGPALKAVRIRMIELGWSRKYINKAVGRIRLMFRHAVSDDLVPPEVLAKLEAVAPLLAGRSEAVERPKRSAVPMDQIERVRDDVNEHTRDLIDLALLTAARPGELCTLTGRDLDRSGEIWTATLTDHKMIHQGRKRVLAFGPKAQLILRKYLKANPSARLFPIQRKTFSQNIKASCLRLGLPVWTGHWLRHNAATEIRGNYGLDEAQAVLGHSDAKTTEIYAHLEPTLIVEVARKRG